MSYRLIELQVDFNFVNPKGLPPGDYRYTRDLSKTAWMAIREGQKTAITLPRERYAEQLEVIRGIRPGDSVLLTSPGRFVAVEVVAKEAPPVFAQPGCAVVKVGAELFKGKLADSWGQAEAGSEELFWAFLAKESEDFLYQFHFEKFGKYVDDASPQPLASKVSKSKSKSSPLAKLDLGVFLEMPGNCTKQFIKAPALSYSEWQDKEKLRKSTLILSSKFNYTWNGVDYRYCNDLPITTWDAILTGQRTATSRLPYWYINCPVILDMIKNLKPGDLVSFKHAGKYIRTVALESQLSINQGLGGASHLLDREYFKEAHRVKEWCIAEGWNKKYLTKLLDRDPSHSFYQFYYQLEQP